MRHEAQEARRTAEIELQEVSAELNLLLEAASDGTDIGHDPCPRCGYHVVANPELPAGHAPTLTTCCPYCGQHMPYGGYFCGQCGMREAGDAAGQIPTGLQMRVATLIVAACWGISVSELQRYVLQFQPVLARGGAADGGAPRRVVSRFELRGCRGRVSVVRVIATASLFTSSPCPSLPLARVDYASPAARLCVGGVLDHLAPTQPLRLSLPLSVPQSQPLPLPVPQPQPQPRPQHFVCEASRTSAACRPLRLSAPPP